MRAGKRCKDKARPNRAAVRGEARNRHGLGARRERDIGGNEMAEKDGGGTGLFSQLKQEAARGKDQPKSGPKPTSSKRVTPPKGGGTPGKGKPTPPNRPKPSAGKSRHPKPPRP